MKRKSQSSRKLLGVNSNLIYGSAIATLIAITPYLFYLHESVPEEKTWDTFLFTFESNFYENANLAMWLFTMKAIPLLLLFIWFFTCRHWWYHVIIIPIAMFSFQLVTAFIAESNLDTFDRESQLIYLFPIMAIVIPSIYLIRAQMFNKINNADKTMEELEEEFKIKPKRFFGKFSDYF